MVRDDFFVLSLNNQGPHLHQPSVPPPSNPAHARKATPVVDAVDLTSMAGGGNGVGNIERSAGARSGVPQSLLNFPNFWAHQRSPVTIATPIQQPQPQPSPSTNRRLHQLPRFRDLFRIDGVVSCLYLQFFASNTSLLLIYISLPL